MWIEDFNHDVSLWWKREDRVFCFRSAFFLLLLCFCSDFSLSVFPLIYLCFPSVLLVFQVSVFALLLLCYCSVTTLLLLCF